jgi:hypothetical protein
MASEPLRRLAFAMLPVRNAYPVIRIEGRRNSAAELARQHNLVCSNVARFLHEVLTEAVNRYKTK